MLKNTDQRVLLILPVSKILQSAQAMNFMMIKK